MKHFMILSLLTMSSLCMAYTVTVMSEIAVGELIDKITILRIKAVRITDPAKLKNINAELSTLEETLHLSVQHSQQLEELANELQKVNSELWDIEDAIREEERHQQFGETFIKLARSVYFTNDRRCEIKRQINMLVGSRLVEEKSYSDYRTAATK